MLQQPLEIVFREDMQLLLWLMVVVASVFLFTKARGWPAFVLFIGSMAHFLVSAVLFIAELGSIASDSPFWQHWGVLLLQNSSAIATLCFPIGFLWYVLRLIRRG
jgi:hypothetical protein